jgi:small subunit ribosomal protein S11
MKNKSQNSGSKSRSRGKVIAPPSGKAMITATMNNTIISITTDKGAVIASSSGGRKYKGARKATSAAADEAAREVGKKVISMGMNTVVAIIKGPGAGRESAVKGLAAAGLSIITITDATGMPHNGCRARKERRI